MRAVLVAAADSRGAAGLPDSLSLTGRDVDLLVLISAGLTDRQIGSSLGLSDKTVSTYAARLLLKFGAANRAELIAKAFVCGVLVGAGYGRPPVWSGIRSCTVHW